MCIEMIYICVIHVFKIVIVSKTVQKKFFFLSDRFQTFIRIKVKRILHAPKLTFSARLEFA